MSLDTLLKCTRPKVNGSPHLNELFQDVNHPLDFFIFFSSATTIPGNLGQSNYTGANMFMTALAQQRRQRGLAASVMHIGPILGVGYLAREGLTSAIQTIAKNLVFMSEQDFCTLFAEAVVASRPGTSAPLEIVSGVAKVPSPAEATPLMSHYTEPQADSVGQLGVRTGYTVPFKAQLAEARDAASVARIISAALLPKLCSLFKADLYTLEKADPATLRLDEMGIDSLLAVEIRGWFVKSIEVNIPVLKILSGVSVAELIAIATETIPPAFVPNIKMDVGEVSLDAVKSELQPEPVKFIQQPEPTTSMQRPPKKLAFEQRHSLSSSQSSVDVDDSPRTMATPADDDTDTLNSSFLSITPPMQILYKPSHPARENPPEMCR
jgi:hybrid polyketide synthase/nonribosomal peptide synthetase ACE1